MSTIVVYYDAISDAASNAFSLAKRAEDYADELSRRVVRRINDIAGGQSTYTSDAMYYINAKITALRAKKECYQTFASSMVTFSNNAKRIDEEVAFAISTNKESFLKNNEHLRIDDWKANILNWLVDIKNSCPLFDVISNAINALKTEMSSLFDEIKYWYKCEGGKELVSVVLAWAGAIVVLVLAIAALLPPICGFIAICAAIGAVIAAINAGVNVITSHKALNAARDGDPAWAKIYKGQDKLSDLLRQTNFGDGILNKLSYIGATTIDGVELFCDVVGIIDAVKKFRSMFGHINNFFESKHGGLGAYMQEIEWHEVLDYDIYGNPCGTKWTIKSNSYGIAETKYTTKSIWNGIESFVMDKPVDCNPKGLRTMLFDNYKIDRADFRKSFSLQGIKDTFKYNTTFNTDALETMIFSRDASRVADAKKFISNLSFSKQIKTYITPIKNAVGIVEKIDSIYSSNFNLKKEIYNTIMKNSDITKIGSELGVDRFIWEKMTGDAGLSKDGVSQKIAKLIGKSYYIYKGIPTITTN